MCKKLFTYFFAGLALLVAIAATLLPQDKIVYLINITRFFEVMIPILAVGALVKYLCCGGSCDKNS
tara:strand:+ start:680 stop:877 length:198 start_codon:yes stop_codon:yes gene_type:complete